MIRAFCCAEKWFRMLDAGNWFLVAGYWMLVSGHRMPDETNV